MSNDDRQAERDYQKDYYDEHRDERSRKNRWMWNNDPEYRRNEIARSQRRRAQRRAETASDRFKQMVEGKRTDPAPTKPPRIAVVKSRRVWVYTTGSLGREIGRSARVVREWLNEGVLPGASTFVSGVAYFSKPYCEAVYSACERLYYLDGRGSKRVLKRLIREELAQAKVSFVPLGGHNEMDRTTAVSAV